MVNLSLVKYGQAGDELTMAASERASRASLHDKLSPNLFMKLQSARHEVNDSTKGGNQCLPTSTPDMIRRLSNNRPPLKLRYKALSHVHFFSPPPASARLPASSVEYSLGEVEPSTIVFGLREEVKKGGVGISSKPETIKSDRNMLKDVCPRPSRGKEDEEVAEKKPPTWVPETRPKSLRLRDMGPPGSVRKKAEEQQMKIPKISVALTRKEIEADFLTMTGSKLSRRPQKRPRHVQQQLDETFPGLRMSSITLNSYKVVEPPQRRKR